ncbi:MAG: hypothetical protein WA952_01270, partial [Lewinella sp.]
MRTAIFLLSAGITLFLLKSCSPEPDDKALFTTNCSSCHRLVEPALLPKSVWENRVLPEMAARMGIRTLGYDPAIQLPPGEYDLARAHGFYPDVATIGLEDWEAVRRYVLAHAPDTLPLPPPVSLHPLEGFTPRSLSLDDRDGSLVSYIGKGTDGLIVGDGYGQLASLTPDNRLDTLISLRLPLVHFTAGDRDSLLLEIGNIYP